MLMEIMEERVINIKVSVWKINHSIDQFEVLFSTSKTKLYRKIQAIYQFKLITFIIQPLIGERYVLNV